MIQKNGQCTLMIDDVIDSSWILEISGFHFHLFSLPSRLEDMTENEMGKTSGSLGERKETSDTSAYEPPWII